MASEWRTAKLGELATFKTGKLDSNAAVPGGVYPFFTCSQETLRTNTYSFDTECVLLAGNNANGIYPLKYFHGKFDAYQRTYVVKPRDPEILTTKFLYYSLRPKLSELRSFSTGAATKFLTLTILNETEIEVPSVLVQGRIAGILSAYDNLIENNQRRIRILEEMARALYREWFVEFRFPGHEKLPRVASLLGDIPQGWKVKRLEALAEIKGGKQLEKEEIQEVGEFPVFGGNGIQGYSDKATHHGFVIAFGRVGAYCGAIHWSYGGAWLNNNSSSVVPLTHDELVLQHLLDFNFNNLRGGAAQPFISNTALAGIELVFPGDALADKFCSLVKPLRLQQVTLESSVANLRRTRDLLLPRLLSGQLD